MKKIRNKTRKIVLALAVGLLLSMVLSVGTVVANGEGPFVMGVVTNEGTDDPINGAKVNATCNSVTVGPNTTVSDGFYELDLATTGCNVGDTVDVVATYGGHTGSGSGTIGTSSLLHVNLAIVCVEIPIPEFATIAVPVGAILGLVLFFNHRKRKKE